MVSATEGTDHEDGHAGVIAGVRGREAKTSPACDEWICDEVHGERISTWPDTFYQRFDKACTGRIAKCEYK